MHNQKGYAFCLVKKSGLKGQRLPVARFNQAPLEYHLHRPFQIHHNVERPGSFVGMFAQLLATEARED